MTISTPTLEDVPLAKLTVDPDVQRALDKLRVDQLAKTFRWPALGALKVSHREDGTYHVVDGQHRMHAAIAAGFAEADAPCLVYSGLTTVEEAELFRLFNDAKKVLPVYKFRVRVVEGDPVAVALNTILERHGWRVEQAKYAGTFAAVSALESVYRGKLNGPGDAGTVCDTLIRVITEAWGHDATGVRSEVIGGVGAVLLRYNTRVDLPKLVRELAQHPSGAAGLIGKAKGLRDYRGGKLSDALAEVVVGMLNKGKRSASRLPEWRSQG